VNAFRKLKFQLKSVYFEKKYLTYIHPILEYSSEFWDNCVQIYSNLLEKIQIESVRIVTGLPCYANPISIYCEMEWEKLSARREVKKLMMLYNIANHQALDYLHDLVPLSVSDTNNLNLYNRQNIHVPFNLRNRQNIPVPFNLRNR